MGKDLELQWYGKNLVAFDIMLTLDSLYYSINYHKVVHQTSFS